VETLDIPLIRGWNGLPLIYFDGVDDSLSTSDVLSQFITDSEAYVFIAFLVRDLGTTEATLTDNEAVFQDTNQQFAAYLKSDERRHFLNDDGSVDSVSRIVQVGAFCVAYFGHSDGDIKLELNETYPQVLVASGDTADISGGIDFAKNGTVFSSVSIGEII